MLTFVTGAARSGKTRLAMQLAAEAGKNVVYVATARRDPNDDEWRARIERHRAERPSEWTTVETACDPRVDLVELSKRYSESDLLLIDSLGTWLADQLFYVDEDALFERSCEVVRAFAKAIPSVIVVGEEIGWGIVPEYPAARLFRVVLGTLGQEFARVADRAYLTIAGYALDLKQGLRIE